MALKIEDVQAQIIAQKNAQAPLANLNSPSQTANWLSWTYITSVIIGVLSQLMDLYQSQFESKLSSAFFRTPNWAQAQVLKFQYGDIVQVNTDFTISYPVIDTTKQIISACAVVPLGNGLTQIKVATGTPPTTLSTPQATALGAYLVTILGSGVGTQIINVSADIFICKGTIYYNGQDPNVQTDVIAALNNYVTLLPFNGLVKLSDIENVILGVTGVVDWQPDTISITPSPIGSTTTNLILTGQINQRSYQTYAGYIVNAGSPNDFASTLTFVVANA